MYLYIHTYLCRMEAWTSDLILNSLFLPSSREVWVALLCTFQDISFPSKWSKHLIFRHHQMMWEVLLYMCSFYWLMNKAVSVNGHMLGTIL